MREPVPVIVPQMNPNDEHAVLVAWQVESGTRISAEQAIVTLETTKATFDVNAPCAGFLHFDVPPKTMVAVGAAIAWVTEDAVAPVLAKQPETSPAESAAVGSGERFTRKALRLIKQHGLNVDDFPGTARVEVEDVERFVQRRMSGAAAPADAEEVAQTPSKMIEVARLAGVYREVVPSTVALSVSAARLQRRLEELGAQYGALSVLEVAIYELSRLLPEYPEFNGYFANGRAWRYRRVAVGFAINLGRGLKVPVVDPKATTPLEVARSVRDLSLRYMRDELAMQDVVGSTFTVTDLSGHGVVHFIPVLNDRQAAILGICAERHGTGHRDLVLAFDHRMTDGMRAAQFLGVLRDALEGESA
jgi:pyruvate/2-oxoglutarate dehydrogenase complex dihydrolipoamide acyltransferase (E2) component